jgi:hypothetical protein
MGVTPACSDSEGRAFIKANRMYRHNVMRINYTTYDVRRAQDVINPSTPHCNVMLLGRNEDDSSVDQQRPYLYARVLGIYHVNATYVGTGMVDYRSHRIDFLWVRWYQHVDKSFSLSGQAPLDSIRFPPMVEPDAFGFVDPDDVLRCCHVIPCFARGLQHSDGRGISHCAQDKLDWKSYYVNRWAH